MGTSPTPAPTSVPTPSPTVRRAPTTLPTPRPVVVEEEGMPTEGMTTEVKVALASSAAALMGIVAALINCCRDRSKNKDREKDRDAMEKDRKAMKQMVNAVVVNMQNQQRSPNVSPLSTASGARRQSA